MLRFRSLIAAMGLVIGLGACSLKPGSSEESSSSFARVTIKLERGARAQRARSPRQTRVETPDQLGHIDCLGVNVSGAGISVVKSASGCTLSAARDLGKFSQMSGDDEISVDLEIPTGPARTIQVFGIDTHGAECPTVEALVAGTQNVPASPPVEIASVTTDIFSEKTLSLSPSITPGAPKIAFCVNRVTTPAIWGVSKWGGADTWGP